MDGAILGEDGSTVESGEALLTSNGIQWEYILPVNIPEGGKLQVKAYDLPDNVASMDFEIEPLTTDYVEQT